MIVSQSCSRVRRKVLTGCAWLDLLRPTKLSKSVRSVTFRSNKPLRGLFDRFSARTFRSLALKVRSMCLRSQSCLLDVLTIGCRSMSTRDMPQALNRDLPRMTGNKCRRKPSELGAGAIGAITSIHKLFLAILVLVADPSMGKG